ncbi:hypothetical protein GCM10027160_48930 [Streptomyces calidiresistens]
MRNVHLYRRQQDPTRVAGTRAAAHGVFRPPRTTPSRDHPGIAGRRAAFGLPDPVPGVVDEVDPYASGDRFHRRACPYSRWLPVTRVPRRRSRSWERAVMPSLGKLR